MTNETQEIDAGALRARLAETPADLRGRIEAALRARHGADGVRVWTWRTQHDPEQHCAACGIPGWRTAPTVAPYATAAAALAALAVAVGLNADGSDPRAEVERLRAESERRSELLDDVAHAHERDVLTIWAALGETHEPPENIAAVVGAVERLRALLAVTQSSLKAASSGRRVTVVDEIERLQRENATLRDAAREHLDARAAYDAADTYEATNADDERRAWERRAAAHDALRALVGGAS